MSLLDYLRAKSAAGRVVDATKPKTPKNAHDDEIAWRNAWINDPNSASYFWVVTDSSGKLILAEYDPCDCEGTDPIAHRHHISEWPGAFKPVVVDTVELDGQKVDVTIPAFEATASFDPFVLVAEPVTLDHQMLPRKSITVAPGVTVVWGHRTVLTNDASGAPYHTADSLLFGTIAADGTAEITQCYGNGDVASHASLEEALAHQHASFDYAAK
jgi:hypothetical protein